METKKIKGVCSICHNEFNYYKCEKSGEYCSRKCYGQNAIKNLKSRFAGRKHKPESIAKMKISQAGELHHRWKKDIGYVALHKWVERNKGNIKFCINCKTTDPRKWYDWANIDGRYKRELSDYIRLCRKCHREFDRKNKTHATKSNTKME